MRRSDPLGLVLSASIVCAMGCGGSGNGGSGGRGGEGGATQPATTDTASSSSSSSGNASSRLSSRPATSSSIGSSSGKTSSSSSSTSSSSGAVSSSSTGRSSSAAASTSSSSSSSSSSSGSSTDTLFLNEPFAGNGDLNGTTGGSGWTADGWQVHYDTGSTIVPNASLSFGKLATSGGYYSHTDDMAGRAVDPNAFPGCNANGLVGAPGCTLWMSVLVNVKSTSSAPGAPVYCEASGPWAGAPYDADGRWAVGIGQENSPDYSIFTGTNGTTAFGGAFTTQVTSHRAPTSAAVPSADLLVIQLTFEAGGGGTIALYVNPSSLGRAAPATADATATVTGSMPFNAISCTAEGNADFDEIRIGNTFAAVTPLGNL